jgi:hypothetical protein
LNPGEVQIREAFTHSRQLWLLQLILSTFEPSNLSTWIPKLSLGSARESDSRFKIQDSTERKQNQRFNIQD